MSSLLHRIANTARLALHKNILRASSNHTRRQFHSEVYVWGSGDNGQLGLGTKADDIHLPTQFSFFSGKGVTQLITGSNHTLALTHDNTIYSWGDVRYGRLGLGTTHESYESQPREILFLRGKKVAKVACGGYHTVACIEEGNTWATYAWGLNNHGQLGVGDKIDRLIPTEIQALRGVEVSSISCGEDFTILCSNRNEVFAFGRNSEGQLEGASGEDRLLPKEFKELQNMGIKAVTSGWGHTLALGSNSKVYSWGSNLHGQCGTGTKTAIQALTPVVLPQHVEVEAIDCGACLTAIKIGSGNETGLWLCGSAGDGKLGGVSKTDQLEPKKMDFFAGQQVLLVACGSDHAFTKTDKGLFGWGYGQHGVLGLGTERLKTFDSPQQILPASHSSLILRIFIDNTSIKFLLHCS